MIEEDKILIKPYGSHYRPTFNYGPQYVFDPEYYGFLLCELCANFRYDVREPYEKIFSDAEYLPETYQRIDWSLLEQTYQRIDWSLLQHNVQPNHGASIHYLTPGFQCVLNPHKCKYDNEKPLYNYDGLKERMEASGLKQQIISISLHPWRITRMCDEFGLGFNCLKEKLFYRMQRSGLKAELVSVVFYHTLYEEIAPLALHPDHMKSIFEESNLDDFTKLIDLLFY